MGMRTLIQEYGMGTITYIHAYMRIYIHTYIHRYIHTYIIITDTGIRLPAHA